MRHALIVYNLLVGFVLNQCIKYLHDIRLINTIRSSSDVVSMLLGITYVGRVELVPCSIQAEYNRLLKHISPHPNE